MTKKKERPHPLGDDRATRVDWWRGVAAFDTGKVGQIAKLVLEAAEAGDDDKMAKLAVLALGLHEPKKAATNAQRLRDALDDACRIIYAVYPQPDPETGETPYTPDEAGPEAWKRLDDALTKHGAAKWLYRRVMGHEVGNGRSHRQQLKRIAEGNADLKRNLDWVLSAAPTPIQRGVGRVK